MVLPEYRSNHDMLQVTRRRATVLRRRHRALTALPLVLFALGGTAALAAGQQERTVKVDVLADRTNDGTESSWATAPPASPDASHLAATYIPDGLVLVGSNDGDDELAPTFDLIYTTGSSTWREGDRALEVHAVGLDERVTLDQIAERSPSPSERVPLRGGEGLVIESSDVVDGRPDHVIGLVWVEWDGGLVEISAHQLTKAEVLQFAEGLVAVTEAEWRNVTRN